MSVKAIVADLCKKVYNKLNNHEFIEVHKMRKKDFTRNRKLGFSDTAMIVLNKTGKGLRSGIRAFLSAYKTEVDSYSVQAFSKGRMRINFTAFVEIFRTSVEHFYAEAEPVLFKGYRVSAIDGSKLNLPFNEESIKEFGIQNSSGDQIQALSSGLYDVLNEIIIDAAIAPFSASEKELAMQHLDRLESIPNDKELIIFDRGYPSAELIGYIEGKGFKYLMRCSSTFISKIKSKAVSDDCIVEHKFNSSKEKFKLRYIKLILSTGTEEYLITNIFDEEFTSEDFKQLYHLRWEIETNYDDIKNKFELENFSGTSPLAVKQDFFATMFLRNMASIMIFENKEEIDKLHNNGENKYRYKANVNNVVSLLKTDLIQMLFTDSDRKRRNLLKKIYREISMAVIPERPDRSFLRKKKHPCSKFSQNQRN